LSEGLDDLLGRREWEQICAKIPSAERPPTQKLRKRHVPKKRLTRG